MKILFIGCVKFSYCTLQQVLNLKNVEIVGVITKSESSFNADFCSLQPLAEQFDIPVYIDKGNNQQAMAEWIKIKEPDVIYCFGWPYLLQKAILEIPRLGVVGYHPAALPQNRGRHPIIWALVLGLKATASTFFFMDEGADSGDILSQEAVTIEDEDNAASLYDKLIDKALGQIGEFTESLVAGCFRKIRQDENKANYWRKRTGIDGQIDWRMSNQSIYNLVRALTHPYVGAHCMFHNEEIKIWEVEKVDCQLPNIEPGKIIEVVDRRVVVKCGAGAVRIIAHEFMRLPQSGDYL